MLNLNSFRPRTNAEIESGRDTEPAANDIVGYHLESEQERQKWLDSGGMKKCADLFEKTARMLCDSLAEIK